MKKNMKIPQNRQISATGISKIIKYMTEIFGSVILLPPSIGNTTITQKIQSLRLMDLESTE